MRIGFTSELIDGSKYTFELNLFFRLLKSGKIYN